MSDETVSDDETMSDDEIMSDESKVDFSRTDTGIYWSIKDCPIPSDDYVLAEETIIEALDDLGYRGYRDPIKRYGERIPSVKLNFFTAFSSYVSEFEFLNLNPLNTILCSSICLENGEHQLLFDMINFVMSRYPEPVNLMVLSKKISDPSEFLRVLQALKLRGCNVLLVQPPDSSPESMFVSAESVIRFTELFGGGDPSINKSESYE